MTRVTRGLFGRFAAPEGWLRALAGDVAPKSEPDEVPEPPVERVGFSSEQAYAVEWTLARFETADEFRGLPNQEAPNPRANQRNTTTSAWLRPACDPFSASCPATTDDIGPAPLGREGFEGAQP